MLRVAFGNAIYKSDSTTGGNAHVYQFVSNATKLGHEIWMWPNDQHPDSKKLPNSRIMQFKQLRNLDALYVRLENEPIRLLNLSRYPYKILLGSALHILEFNTVPEFGIYIGNTEKEIRKHKKNIKYFGKGCDLAICVSRELEYYVKEFFDIKHAVFISNGSDPELFRPDLNPVKHIRRNKEGLNVVWMGSSDIPWHNLDLLLETARLINSREESSNIQFYIIGKELESKLIIPPNVICVGEIEYKHLPYWLAGMDIGLILYHQGPSFYSSPLKLFDYMSSGLTVVGTYQPQVYDVFNELNQLDLIVYENNPEALAIILLKLLINRERRYVQSEVGRRLIIHKYNWQNLVNSIFNEIQSLL